MKGGPIPSSQSGCFIRIVGVALELIPTFDIYLVVTFVKCTTGQLGMVRLQARTLPSRSETIGGVCLKCALWSYIRFSGPSCARRNLGQGLGSKYEDGCMTCYGAWTRGTWVQGPKPCIEGPIPVQLSNPK